MNETLKSNFNEDDIKNQRRLLLKHIILIIFLRQKLSIKAKMNAKKNESTNE